MYRSESSSQVRAGACWLAMPHFARAWWVGSGPYDKNRDWARSWQGSYPGSLPHTSIRPHGRNTRPSRYKAVHT